jgi:serine/threonine protein phosphatase PrpC
MTGRGRVREHNEDSMLVPEATLCGGECRGHLEFHADTGDVAVAVADGVGGQQGGQEASSLVIQTLGTMLHGPATATAASDAVQQCQVRLVDYAQERPELRDYASTVAGVWLSSDAVVVFNVGDSRVYRLDGDILNQLSIDQSVVGELLQSGMITPREAESHPQRHVITETIGAFGDLRRRTVTVKTSTHAPRTHSTFLVCSDGVTDNVPIDQMEECLHNMADPAGALYDAAMDGGGADNTSIVVLTVDLAEELP